MKEIEEYSHLMQSFDDEKSFHADIQALKKENQALRHALKEQTRQLSTLKKSEKLLQTTLSHTYALIFRFKLNDYGEPAFTFIGGNHYEHLLLSADYYADKSLDKVLRDEILNKLKPYYLQALKGETKQFEMEVNGIRFSTYFLPIFENGQIVEVVGSSIEVKGVEEISNRLQSSEQKFRKVFDAAEDAIVLLDDNQRYVDANEAACRLFGISKEQLLEFYIEDLTVENRNNSLNESWEIFMKEGISKGEVDILRADGQIQHIEYNATARILPGLHLAIIRDTKERKEIEEHLRQTETLKAIGELAAGIGHEIRNPLTSLKGFIQLLQSEINDSSTNNQYFEIILSELQRLEEIISEFVLLSKPKTTLFQIKSVTNVLNETIALLDSQAILNNVEISTKFQEGLPLIKCESNQLKQVFINFIKNGIEAMPSGGELVINAQQVSSKEICIQIQDNGIGMEAAALSKLGTPFYTTKEKGTGLGLMVSFKIIRDHQGRVKVRSIRKKGTTFEVYLPITDDKEKHL